MRAAAEGNGCLLLGGYISRDLSDFGAADWAAAANKAKRGTNMRKPTCIIVKSSRRLSMRQECQHRGTRPGHDVGGDEFS